MIPVTPYQTGPDAVSSDYAYMNHYWGKVESILGGIDTMKRGETAYMPKFPDEADVDYKFRLECAKFTNVFRDVCENLAAKPFVDEVYINDEDEDANETIKRIIELSENIDGQGNHIHVFTADVFFNGIAYSIDWILVDYTKDVPQAATVKTEKDINARPYWVRVPARNMLAVYSDMIDGVEQFTHCRICEDYSIRDGYSEQFIKRVRVLERPLLTAVGEQPAIYGPAIWLVYEAEVTTPYIPTATPQGAQFYSHQTPAGYPISVPAQNWVLKEQGPITIGEIPLVPFMTGRRKGVSWCLEPPLKDTADLQVILYQQESALNYAKIMTAFPMLSGNGVMPELVDGKPKVVPVSPKTVLYAPPGTDGNHGQWSYIEPGAQSLRFLADDIKDTTAQLRELGRQPLTAQTGNLTVVTTAFAAQKGNSAIQAWALNLKDAVENALRYTAMWLGDEDDESEPEFVISIDFDIEMSDDKNPEVINTMRQNMDLSQRTYWHEMRRRGILSPEFDPDEEEEALMAEFPAEEPLPGEEGMEFAPEGGPQEFAPEMTMPPPGATNGAGVPLGELEYDEFAP